MNYLVETTYQKQICSGYAIEKKASVTDLFQALGFHLATEMNGVIEFRAIDEFLKQEHPELINFLKKQQGSYNTNAYTWVEVHTYVEDEHFAAAIDSLRNAKMHYLGNLNETEINMLIQKGVNQFYDFVNTIFFD